MYMPGVNGKEKENVYINWATHYHVDFVFLPLNDVAFPDVATIAVAAGKTITQTE